MRRAAAALAVLLSLAPMPSRSDPDAQVLSFADLNGWAEDRLDEALAVFVKTCGDLTDPDWQAVCAVAKTGPQARTFFEVFFRPVLVRDGTPGLLTGYFEPELKGSRVPDARFNVPIYRRPPELVDGQPFATREEIEAGDLLSGRGLEIAWVDDPVEAFFLQVQGSGRIRMTDGSVIRVGYAAKNGQPYRSIGEELVRRGVYTRHQVSAQVIRNWVRRNPDEGRQLLLHNPSFVFFREVSEVPAAEGPLGAMNRSVTPMRTIAVDPAYVPLGAPVWVERGGQRGFRRLMVAQDTGSAIKGAQRADIFFGTGTEAGRRAGAVKDPGRMVILLPIQRAFALVESMGGPT